MIEQGALRVLESILRYHGVQTLDALQHMDQGPNISAGNRPKEYGWKHVKMKLEATINGQCGLE